MLALFIELLLRASKRSGGLDLTFGERPGQDLSLRANFVFSYLPTIISVIFGLLWATANHDYMRMEPLFQLSRPEGATAKDSLLLEYPYIFPLFLPWEAFKRRHWAVLYSTILLLSAHCYSPHVRPV